MSEECDNTHCCGKCNNRINHENEGDILSHDSGACVEKAVDHMFHPFVDFGCGMYSLCIQNGEIVDEPLEIMDWKEYYLDYSNNGNWHLAESLKDNNSRILYIGKIPDRQFFLELIKNTVNLIL